MEHNRVQKKSNTNTATLDKGALGNSVTPHQMVLDAEDLETPKMELHYNKQNWKVFRFLLNDIFIPPNKIAHYKTYMYVCTYVCVCLGRVLEDSRRDFIYPVFK